MRPNRTIGAICFAALLLAATTPTEAHAGFTEWLQEQLGGVADYLMDGIGALFIFLADTISTVLRYVADLIWQTIIDAFYALVSAFMDNNDWREATPFPDLEDWMPYFEASNYYLPVQEIIDWATTLATLETAIFALNIARRLLFIPR